jgi:hypothetical protein
MTTPFPITRYLVPPQTLAPTGLARLDQPLTGGLPARIALSPDLALVLTLTTGLVASWLDLDPSVVISQSADQTRPLSGESQPDVLRSAMRLFVLRSNEIVGSLPLVAGREARLASSTGALVDLIVLGWEIRAGTVKGPGDYGSTISLAWRDAAAGSDRFLPPPISPTILSRLKDRLRGTSELGAGLSRLPAGYGPPRPPVAPMEILVLDVELELDYVNVLPQPEIAYYTYEAL